MVLVVILALLISDVLVRALFAIYFVSGCECYSSDFVAWVDLAVSDGSSYLDPIEAGVLGCYRICVETTEVSAVDLVTLGETSNVRVVESVHGTVSAIHDPGDI